MQIYNSLTKSIQKFNTRNKQIISIYVCGITPYDTTHLGHAFTYISFDLFIRYLKFKGYDVNYTQNVTDINDRDNDILKRAKDQNTTWQNLTYYWTELFLSDMEYLNWIKPNHYLYASKQIDKMIDVIEKLVSNNFAYVVDGNVYLDIAKKKDFGKLSGFSKAKMLKIANEFEEDTENKNKKNPLDITLWKKKEENQASHIPYFNSSYGLGRPGWHIECSAMAISSLGEQIDVHGGGIDLIYPHHEAEIAQSEGATSKIPFSSFWIHTGQVAYQGEKMSKSLGNLVMVSKLRKKYSSNAIRFMLLSNHYRNEWEFKQEQLDLANQKVNLMQKSLNKNIKGLDIASDFIKLIENDLNSPEALSLIYENIDKLDSKKTKELLNAFGFMF